MIIIYFEKDCIMIMIMLYKINNNMIIKNHK